MNDNQLKRQITSGVIWKFGERFAAQGVSFIVSLVLARILMPDDYGVVAMVNVFISIADVLVSGGLNSALIQNNHAGQKEFSTIFYCNFIFSIFLYGILFVSAPYIARFYSMPSLTLVIRVFSLRLLPASYQAIQVAYVSKKMMFKKFFFSTLGGTIFSAVVGILMATKGFGVWSLVAQYMTYTVIDTLILFITVRWHPSLYFNVKEAFPMIKFGWNVMCANVIGVIFNQLNSFIIGKKYTTSDLAYYDRGKNLPRLVTDNISSSLQSVLFPAMANSGNVETIKKIARKSTRYMAYILFPLMIGMIVVAEPLVEVLLTKKWLGAVPFIRLICLEGMIGVMDSTNGLQVLKARGKSEKILKLEFVKKPIAIIVIIISMQFGVMGVAVSVPLTAFITMLINTGAATKVSGYTIVEQLKDIFPAFAMSTIMGIVVYIMNFFNWNIYVKLVMQILTGIVIYIILSVVTKNEEYKSILKLLRGITKRGETD